MDKKTIPDFASVCAAADQISGHAHRTPVLESSSLNRYLGTQVRFKAEHMQVIGAFKFRGAFNAISRLSREQLDRGVITFSSGNHGQAVAKAATLLGSKATVVMPTNAPQIKLQGVKAYGGEVVLYDPLTEDREQVADKINPGGAKAIIPPFNHPDVIAGQGTCALELLTDYPDTEQIIVPCGGGGLLSGTALAKSGLKPSCQVFGVEPETADDGRQSFRQGRIVTIGYPDTVADGVRTLALGDIPFTIIQREVSDIVTVSEDAIKTALSTLIHHLKQWLEPSAVLGLAALMENQIPHASEVGIILSGGNADIDIIKQLMSEHPAQLIP